jgi:hypothetical protein
VVWAAEPFAGGARQGAWDSRGQDESAAQDYSLALGNDGPRRSLRSRVGLSWDGSGNARRRRPALDCVWDGAAVERKRWRLERGTRRALLT